jgi:hypothetical protein
VLIFHVKDTDYLTEEGVVAPIEVGAREKHKVDSES